MSDLPQALKAHLGGSVTTLCHCWKLTRRDGLVLGFTDHDRPLAFADTHFEPQAGLGQSEAISALGLSADRVEVEGALDSEHLSEADILAGRFDGAVVDSYLVNWAEVEQRVKFRSAVIGAVRLSDGAFLAELESPLRHLDRPNGRHLRRACDAELGDQRCGFDLGTAGHSGMGVVLSAISDARIAVDGLGSFGEGWFSLGRLTWTSGANAGRSARVREHRTGIEGTVLALDEPFAAAQGDAFDIVSGCDKRFATCRAKFSNNLNFRGFPHLPGNDAAYAYVTEGQVFDGGPLVE